MNIKLDGYEAITGETSIDIVNQMADLQWPKTGDQISISGYMQGVAKRVKQQHNAMVRWCCADHFLKDLITAKVVEVKL